jgi:hypothetical protein
MDKIFGIGIGVPGLLKIETGASVWNSLYRIGETTLSDLISKRLLMKTYQMISRSPIPRLPKDKILKATKR